MRRIPINIRRIKVDEVDRSTIMTGSLKQKESTKFLIIIEEKGQEWSKSIICDTDQLKKFRDDIDKALESISTAETLGISEEKGKTLDERYENDPLCANCPYKLSSHCNTCIFELQSPLERKLYLELTRERISFKIQYGLDRNGKQISVIGKDYNNPDNNFKNVLTVVDFYIEKKNQGLCIYTDGHTYHERTEEQAQRDKNIDRQLQTFGHTVYRYTGKDINENMEKNIREIKKWIGN